MGTNKETRAKTLRLMLHFFFNSFDLGVKTTSN